MEEPNNEDFLSHICPDIVYLMSVSIELLVPYSSYEKELSEISTTNQELYQKLVQINLQIVNNILKPIVKEGYLSNKPISKEKILQFIEYSKQEVDLLRPHVDLTQTKILNLEFYQRMIDQLGKQQKLEKESIQMAIQLVSILTDYIENIMVLIKERRSHLELALKEIDQDEFLQSIYGSVLALLCIKYILKDKKLKDNERFLSIVESGLDYANELDAYTDTLDILSNPEELELLRKAESESL